MTISQARIRCAFLRDRTISPVSSSMPSSRTSTSSPGDGRRLVLPLVERNQALGLVADIHDDLVADDLDHLARDDATDLEALARAQELVERVGAVLRRDQGRELVITDIKFTKKITIYHVRVSFPYPPLASSARADRRWSRRSNQIEPDSIPLIRARSQWIRQASSTALAVELKRTPLLNARGGSMQTTIIRQTSLNTTAGLRSAALTTQGVTTPPVDDGLKPLRPVHAESVELANLWSTATEPMIGRSAVYRRSPANFPCSR